MSWFGKIMGGSVGFMLGGPIGALVGATLGHALMDEKNRARYAEKGQMTGLEKRQAVFFTATFAMLGKLAKADGRVCEQEVNVVREFMRDQLHLNSSAQQFAINIFNQAKNDATPFTDYAQQLGSVFSNDAQLRMMFFELLFTVAMADGELHPAEDSLLRAALGPLGLSSEVFETVKRQFVNDLSHHYAILGLNENVDMSEVKKVYRKLVSEYHPDKVIAKGLPEDFIKFAENRFREINEAYEAITKGRTA